MGHRLSSLDLHFHLPRVNKVEAGRPFIWLARGWSDIWAQPVVSLAYGVCFAMVGYLILTYTAEMPYLFTASLAGFFLMGPLAAAGLYEISRRHAEGMQTTFADSLSGIRRNAESIAYFGLFLAFVTVGWERISSIMFALFYRGDALDVAHFYAEVFLTQDYLGFVASYVVVGLLIAGLVFALMAFSIPHTMDKGVDNITAAMTSLRAVSNNLRAMAVWAGMIFLLMGLGFATWMLAMVVVIPLLGHATWHAYKDVIADEN